MILARVPHTDLYKDKGIYPTVQEVPHIKIFRIDASLYYANVEHFRKKLYKLTEGKQSAVIFSFTYSCIRLENENSAIKGVIML